MPSIEFTFGDIEIFIERLNNEVLEKFPFDQPLDFATWYEEAGSKYVEEADSKLSRSGAEEQRKRNDSFKILLKNWVKDNKDSHNLILYDLSFLYSKYMNIYIYICCVYNIGKIWTLIFSGPCYYVIFNVLYFLF